MEGVNGAEQYRKMGTRAASTEKPAEVSLRLRKNSGRRRCRRAALYYGVHPAAAAGDGRSTVEACPWCRTPIETKNR